MTTFEALVAKIDADLAALNLSITTLVEEYKIAVAQALALEDAMHRITKSMEGTDCAGQNCAACANPCETHLEAMR